jgi:hypothetical protein
MPPAATTAAGGERTKKSQNARPRRGSSPLATSSKDVDLSDITDSDDFRMYCMKVLPCSKRVSHDWTTCAFSHAGEKARRRDPRKYSYTGIACVDMKETGSCERGDDCPYAHSTFEYWLHPTRYRTQLCKDLGHCKRDICFFAHRTEELRVPDEKPYISPEQLALSSLSGLRRSMERDRKQPEDLAYTPYGTSYNVSEVVSPRVSSTEPTPVRLSAPNYAQPRGPQSPRWVQQPVRKSANDALHVGTIPPGNVPASGAPPIDSHKQRADEIALADALARLSVTLQQNQNNRVDVIETVNAVLQQALDQKESSLGFEFQHTLGGLGHPASAEYSVFESSARNSSDVDTPRVGSRENGANEEHFVDSTHRMDPWASASHVLH